MAITNESKPSTSLGGLNKVVQYETFDTLTTTFDTETRTFDQMATIWSNLIKAVNLDYLMTEDDNYLVSESEDFLITEQCTPLTNLTRPS